MPPVDAGLLLEGSGGWTGIEQPPTLRSLRGRVVVVFFWTAHDIACLRVIEELRRLDHRHGEDVVILAVHTGPPFVSNLGSEIERHRLFAPVLDDPEGATATSFGVRHRPSVVVVDQRGDVVERLGGEGHSATLARVVTELLEVDPRRRRRLVLAAPPTVPEPLAFPAKVAVSADGRRLAIADTGHDRVVVCTLDGLVLDVYTGFVQPHGVAFDVSGVVVCDTVPGRIVRSNGEVLADAIASPWDLAAAGDGSWIVAEAGGHRLVRVRPGEIATRVAAGTGARGAADGEDVQAELDQPSGVARTPEGIVFVDAGSGRLRRYRRERRSGDVVTLPLAAGALVHPRGVASAPEGGPIYIADTLADRILVWDGDRLGDLGVTGLRRPGGLDVLADGRLVIADTDHHRVVIVDPAQPFAAVAIELDETWVHARRGSTVAAVSGGKLAVPVSLDLVDEVADAPLEVVVEAWPRELLAGAVGPQAVAAGDAFEVGVGDVGEGLLLVSATATIQGGRGQEARTRIQRRRHRFEVTAPV